MAESEACEDSITVNTVLKKGTKRCSGCGLEQGIAKKICRNESCSMKFPLKEKDLAALKRMSNPNIMQQRKHMEKRADILNIHNSCDIVILMHHKHGSGDTVTFYGTEGAGVSFIGNKSTIESSESGRVALNLFRKFMEVHHVYTRSAFKGSMKNPLNIYLTLIQLLDLRVVYFLHINPIFYACLEYKEKENLSHLQQQPEHQQHEQLQQEQQQQDQLQQEQLRQEQQQQEQQEQQQQEQLQQEQLRQEQLQQEQLQQQEQQQEQPQQEQLQQEQLQQQQQEQLFLQHQLQQQKQPQPEHHHHRVQQQQRQQHFEQEKEQNTVKMSQNLSWQKQVLSKILGEEEAHNVLHCQKVASEENVEVVDLTLNQSERFLLYLCCKQFFDQDAWCAVGSNMKHRSEATGVILPVYTSTVDPYWLFYFPGKLDIVLNARSTTKITGYWLDSCDPQEQLYQLMAKRSKIVGRNIIKTEHGSMYYICDSDLFPGATWTIPPIFNDVIIKVLTVDNV